MVKKQKHQEIAAIAFSEVAAALIDEHTPFARPLMYRLSGLEGEDRIKMAGIWQEIPLNRRLSLLEDIAEFIEADMLLDYSEIGWIALADRETSVRLAAVQALKGDESPRFARHLLGMLSREKDIDLRAGVVQALCGFMDLASLDEIPESLAQEIETALFGLLEGSEHSLVQRKALEAIGYSYDDRVDGYIEKACQSEDDDWLASAMVAIGNSTNPAWRSEVLSAVRHTSPIVREEAARAIGRLEFKDADQPLLKLLKDEDADVRAAAIWSLSNVGGKNAEKVLQGLVETSTDEDELVLLEEALDNLAFNQSTQNFELFEFDEDDIEESMHEYDPDDDDEDF